MKRIVLKCPTCDAQRFQAIPEQILDKRNQNEKGIVVILIPEKIICEHLFILHVDKNFQVRDALSQERITEVNKKKIIRFETIEKLLKNLSNQTKKKIISRL